VHSGICDPEIRLKLLQNRLTTIDGHIKKLFAEKDYINKRIKSIKARNFSKRGFLL